MTISTTTSRVDYAGNGVTTAFPVPFAFFGAAELTVIERSATGVETVRTLTTDYTVSGGNGSTGTVTAVVAPASGVQWTILRSTARTQLTDYVANDAFPAETHERALDRLTAQIQEVERDAARSLVVPATDSGGSLVIPTSAARALQFLGFDAAGQPIAASGGVSNVVVSSFMATVLDDTTATAAQTTLGGTATGRALFTAASAAAAQDVILPVAWTDVASAATTDLGATNAANLRITGTTTITAFGTAPSGTRRQLRFAGALTLTHNATSLILPGAANITTAAGDTAVAISLGSGNWVVVEYMRAAHLNAPLPISSAGVGQFTVIAPGSGAAAVLPSGGTWAYSIFRIDNAGGTFDGNLGTSIAAGGATIGAGLAGRSWVGWCWRIT